MKVSKTIYPTDSLPFNQLQEFYRAVNNRIYGITRSQPIRSQFPIGNMADNKFKINMK